MRDPCDRAAISPHLAREHRAVVNVSSGVVCMLTVLQCRAEKDVVAVAACPFQRGGTVLLAVPVLWGLCRCLELLPAALWVPDPSSPLLLLSLWIRC